MRTTPGPTTQSQTRKHSSPSDESMRAAQHSTGQHSPHLVGQHGVCLRDRVDNLRDAGECHRHSLGWVDGWVDEWVDGWVGGWMDMHKTQRDPPPATTPNPAAPFTTQQPPP